MKFVGYEEGSKAYRCYNESNRKIVISRDVRFVRTPMHHGVVSIELTSNENKKLKSNDSYKDKFGNESSMEGDSGSENSYLSADDEFSE